MNDMSGHVNRVTLRRAAIDFALALAFFWLLAFAVGSPGGKAHAVPLYAPQELPQLAPDSAHHLTVLSFEARGSRAGLAHRQSLGLLSLAFALLAALNLAIWRHLRRAYASPRRGVWRRG
jgi:hypothetical protein